MLFGSLFHYWNIFCVKRTLVSIIQNISAVFDMRMLSTFLESRFFSVIRKRQEPELNAVIRFITYSEAFIFQELRICKERFFLCGAKNAQPLLTFFLTFPDAGSKQICGIAVSFERTRYPQTVNIHITVSLYRNPCIFCRDIFDKTLSSLHTLQENKPFSKPFCKPRLP